MSLRPALTALLATVLWLGGCATRAPSTPDMQGMPGVELGAGEADQVIERGMASWYGEKFHGRRTASGEAFDMHALTAAHRTLPFGTRVRVRHAGTGREVLVRINDRGPHVKGRIIDLSRAAAASIGLVQAGVAPVVVLAP
ncbi:MAG: septal ring lytic transglycosylase RlpA family protein [Hydrogenophaga sp.]|uniref:septal ring lytic transglycosylase RlpA family protein n=1 Tax=Hydrogenophaga sp. TaxID=1904254 RepID=UPI003D12D0FC